MVEAVVADFRVEVAQMVHGKKQNHSPIVAAIGAAERETTAEIRVHLSKRFIDRNPTLRARKVFVELQMHKTELRNGVLLYVNLRRRKFAIVGDEGIHSKVGQDYWNSIADSLISGLKTKSTEEAIANTVLEVGMKYFKAEQRFIIALHHEFTVLAMAETPGVNPSISFA